MAEGLKVLITRPDIPKCAFDILSEKCELIVCSTEDSFRVHNSSYRAQILEKVKGVHGIFWLTKEILDKEVLDAAGPSLRVISTMSSGLDNVDIEEVKKRGIQLGNTYRVLDAAVADIAVGLLIYTARRFHEARQKILDSNWNYGDHNFLGLDIGKSIIGIVGLGGIGQAIARRLKTFQVSRILYSGHKRKPEGDDLCAEFVTFDYLLEKSDFVIAACPLTPETTEMFNESAFNKMKKTSIFINISRGGVVDQHALILALKQKKIYAAGLDVMTPEPLPKDHPLTQLPNCILLPHLGSATVKTRSKMASTAAQNILKGLAGEPMLSPIC